MYRKGATKKKTKMTKTNSFQRSVIDNVMRDKESTVLNEEWNNFVKRIGEVGNIVKDMASGDKVRSEAATILADKYLEGKVIFDEDVQMTVKSDRTVINQKAFKSLENQDSGEMDRETFMAEMSKDAERRFEDRKIRREKADTLKTRAMKAFRRGEFEKALSCYNKAMEFVKDDAMLLCDRALTNIKLGRYEEVFEDCRWALRLNENSFKARLYRAKAHKELEEFDKLEECRKELDEIFPQHQDLVKYFLEKKIKPREEAEEEEEEEEEETITIEI